MSTQQKDVLVNKIMVYITAAFSGTILWYVMFSLMQSSLVMTGYYVSIGCAVLCIILGFLFLFHKKIRKKILNASSYARLSFVSALLFLVLWTPYIARTLGLGDAISRLPRLSSITYCAHMTLLVSYIALAIAILINIILVVKSSDTETNNSYDSVRQKKKNK